MEYRKTWHRARTTLSLLAVAAFLGVAIVAPFSTSDEAEAAPLPNMARITQQFVPNESPEADLVYTDVTGTLDSDIARQEREAKEKEKAEAEAAAEEAEDSGSSSSGSSSSASRSVPRYTGGGSPEQWMREAGIAEKNWGYVDFIVSSESGWNPNAVNASSGASGLVQALPCGKVPGSCFDPVDNLRWASGYAEGRYGSWAKAYDFWQANHWW